jgi:hypothetical protein
MSDGDVCLGDVSLSGSEATELAEVLDHLFILLMADPVSAFLDSHVGDAGATGWLRDELDRWSRRLTTEGLS